jgi:hypothetical protein
VSLSQIVQSKGEGGVAQIVIITHKAREGSVQSALADIASKSFANAPPVLLRIEES